MKAVTIDQLEMKDHVRWAQDQQEYDVSFVNESHLVAPHPEILGTSAIYSSKFEELFELQKKNVSWAAFAQPSNFHLFSKRFFSYRLFPSIHWEEGQDQEEETSSQDQDNQHSPSEDLIKEVLKVQKKSQQKHTLFEKDKTTILNLLETIKGIDRMLKQINARKLQYQKG
jgi:hypothetical protein